MGVWLCGLYEGKGISVPSASTIKELHSRARSTELAGRLRGVSRGLSVGSRGPGFCSMSPQDRRSPLPERGGCCAASGGVGDLDLFRARISGGPVAEES